MICSSCGTQNPAGTKFCKECGTRMGVACASCGIALLPDSRFCGECGTPVPGAPTPRSSAAGPGSAATAAAVAPVAERRVVSILFADLVGFTTLAEGHDAEETRELLSGYFELARTVIGRYGGTVEKFIGDAVMAVWGAPVAREDDAERAVRAALELVDAVRGLGSGIAARAGVLTGEAAVTLGATNEGMVAGDLVNTASRLQGAAAPGTVLVGEATERAASRAIAFEPAGEYVLKGKAAPVPAWRAMRVVAERGGRNRSETLEAPFVGRDEELRFLKELFHATAREKRARLVSVIGPAGIGKSRLAWELSKYIDGLIEPVWYHDGRSPAYGDGISFWALGEMVRGRCGLLETDDERTTRAKVTETLAQHVLEQEQRRWIEPALLALLGIDAGSVASEQLFGAWRAFFEQLAASAPVVLVFEDFHYADAGLVDFVDHLLEWSRAAPIMVVTLARPEFIERRPDWGAGKRNFTSTYLEPLSEPAMRELLAGLVPGLPERAVRTIVGRADGIPLYAVETVRMLLAEGRLALDAGVYRPVGDLANLAVPETLTALIASRLDTLPAEDRALVSDAAVLGQGFSLPALAAVSGLEAAALEPRLRALVRRELLTLEADPRRPEHGQYAFVQALIREVAYNTLARRDRKSRHLAAARYFESLGTDELAGALAAQYLAAHRNAPEGPEASALRGQARIALRAAADRAAALGSHQQAIAFLTEALSVADGPAEEADLLERVGESATAAGDNERAEQILRDALARRETLGDRVAIARTVETLGRALLNGFRTEAAVGLLERHSAGLGDLASDRAVIRLDGQLGRGYLMRLESRRAIEVADRVLPAAEAADLVEVVADVLVTRGAALCGLNRAYEGNGALEAGEKLAEAHGLHATVLRALGNRANWLLDGDPRAGLEVARSALALAARLGRRSIQLYNNATLGGIRVGEWDWLETLLEAGLAEVVDPSFRTELLNDLGWLKGLRGEEIADLLVELDALVAGQTERQFGTASMWVRMFAVFAAGDLDEARTVNRRLAELFPEAAAFSLPFGARCALWAGDAPAARADLAALDATGARGPAIEADRTTIRAGIAALEGRPSDALPAYREALRAWRDLGLRWDEAQCAIDMATLLDPADPDVRAAAEAAREILVRLKAAPFIARLDAAMARTEARAESRATR